MGVSGVESLDFVKSFGVEGGPSQDLSNLPDLLSLQIQHDGPLLLQPLSSLKHLEITGGGGITLDPKALSSLPNLTKLEILTSRLSSLHPEQLKNLSSLRDLSLHDNYLSSLPPGLLDGCPLLENLDLSRNQLTSFPDGFFQHQDNLKFINLQQNPLRSLPDGLLAGKQHLRSFKLKFNGLPKCFNGRSRCSQQDNPILVLPPSLLTNSSIQEVSLEDANLPSLHPDLFQGCKGEQ